MSSVQCCVARERLPHRSEESYLPVRAIGKVSVASMSRKPVDEMIMNTTTFDLGYTTEATKTNKTGFFGRLVQSCIAAREAEARRRIAIHFANLSDHQLASLGMGARDIELVRAGQSVRIDLMG
jgi:hypothetical protein